MGWCDEVLGFCEASGGEVDPPRSVGEVEARLAALPIEDLVKAWRDVSTTSLKGGTSSTYAFTIIMKARGKVSW